MSWQILTPYWRSSIFGSVSLLFLEYRWFHVAITCACCIRASWSISNVLFIFARYYGLCFIMYVNTLKFLQSFHLIYFVVRAPNSVTFAGVPWYQTSPHQLYLTFFVVSTTVGLSVDVRVISGIILDGVLTSGSQLYVCFRMHYIP